MPNLPTIENEEPILTHQAINSTAKSSDEFARYLGAISQSATQMAEAEYDFQSKSNAILSQNMMGEAVAKAQINMLNNPGQALAIAKNTEFALQDIKNASTVNKADRLHLSQMADHYKLVTQLQGAKTAHRQSLLTTQQMIYEELPKVTFQIGQLYASGQPKKAHQLTDKSIASASDALRMGAISYPHYARIVAMLDGTRVVGEGKFELLKKSDPTAVDLTKSNLTAFGNVNPDPSNRPVTHYTNYHQEVFDEDTAFNHLKSEMNQYGQLSETSSFSMSYIQSPEKVQQLNLYYHGVKDAEANILANTPWFHMMNRYNFLKDKGSSHLTQSETGEFNRYDNFIKSLNTDFYGTLIQTHAGQAIHEKRLMSDERIENSALTPEEKLNRQRENNDWEKTQLINLGFSQHIPSELYKLDNRTMAPVYSAFSPGGDPSLLTSTLGSTSPYLHPYIANSLQKANQKAVTLMLSHGGNLFDVGFANKMVMYNQDVARGDPKLTDNLKIVKDSKDKIFKEIDTDPDLSKIFNYYLSLEGKSGIELANGYKNAIRNYVYGEAQLHNDPELNNLDDYLKTAKDNILRSESIYEDRHARLNNSSLKQPDYVLKALGPYAIDQVYEKLKDKISRVDFLDLMDRAPLMLVNQPNNVLTMINTLTGEKVLDENNHPLFEEPLTSILVHDAVRKYPNLSYEAYIKKITEVKPFHALETFTLPGDNYAQ